MFKKKQNQPNMVQFHCRLDYYTEPVQPKISFARLFVMFVHMRVAWSLEPTLTE